MRSRVVFGGVTYVQNFQRRQVGSVEDRDRLVFQGSVDHPALFVSTPLLFLLSEDSRIIPGYFSFWEGCHSSWVGQSDKGCVGNTSVLLRWKDDPKEAVLPSSEVALNQYHFGRQELVDLLYG